MATLATNRPVDETIAAYRRDGFATVRGLFGDEEVARFRAEGDRIVGMEALFDAGSGRGAIRQGDLRRDRLDPVIDLSPLFAALGRDERLLALAGEALGGEAQLLKDKLIVKPPGARGYGLHQDITYWQELGLAGDCVVTLALAIDASTRENGAIEYVPGAHHAMLTEPGVIADPDEALFSDYRMATGEAGAVFLHSALTPHRSGYNRSAAMRRILFLTYARDDRPDMYGYYQRIRRSF